MLDRVKILENNILELENLRNNFAVKDIASNLHTEWALRYGLLESIQIVIDISCALVSKNNLGNPETYGQCVELLNRNKYLDDQLSGKLVSMIGLRNLLIHEYSEIDIEKLYSLLDNLNDLRSFIQDIEKYF